MIDGLDRRVGWEDCDSRASGVAELISKKRIGQGKGERVQSRKAGKS